MSKQQPVLNRRTMLKALTIGGTATAALAVTGVNAVQAKTASTTDKKSSDYHETAHIRSYYDSLRG